MTYQYIKTSIDSNIAQLTLNRPNKHNALCIDLVKEMNHFITSLINNNNINALFILGNEKAFSAGGDLIEMQELSEAEAEKRSQYVQATFKLLEQLPIPTISFVRGICMGGGLELVLHCDFCIATEDTRLALPEVKYGMIPGAGGATKLPLRMNTADSNYFLLTGDEIPLSKAYSSGIVQKVILRGDFDVEIKNQSEYFANANQASLKAIKRITQLHNKANIENVYAEESANFAALLHANGKKGIDKNFKTSK